MVVWLPALAGNASLTGDGRMAERPRHGFWSLTSCEAKGGLWMALGAIKARFCGGLLIGFALKAGAAPERRPRANTLPPLRAGSAYGRSPARRAMSARAVAKGFSDRNFAAL